MSKETSPETPSSILSAPDRFFDRENRETNTGRSWPDLLADLPCDPSDTTPGMSDAVAIKLIRCIRLEVKLRTTPPTVKCFVSGSCRRISSASKSLDACQMIPWYSPSHREILM